MSSGERLSRTDLAICIWFPVSFVVLLVIGLMAHRSLPQLIANLLGFFWVLVLFITPVYVILRIIFRRNRVAAVWIWVESVLAGVWLGAGSFTLLDHWTHGYLALLFALVITVAVALTPLIAQIVRPSS